MNALHNIPYGLYILSAGKVKPNACVINTLMQVTSVPNQISVTVNKNNFTTKIIEKEGEFNVSILTSSTPFSLIERFGFSSGKDKNKFDGFGDFALASNGIPYITKHTNAYLSCKVVSSTDVGTHLTFVAELTESTVLSTEETLTYSHYLKNIKPKTESRAKGVWVCRICGYVYEGEKLPDNFICPICKHGADDFEWREATITPTKTITPTPSVQQKEKYYCPVCGNIEESPTPPSKCVICGAKMIKI